MKKSLIVTILFSVFTVLNCCLADTYTQELKDAYNWAYSNGITTQPTIDSANMKGKITREEMAKMISNYAINILGKTPDTSKVCLFLDSNINPNLVQYVTKSCQLGLMGQGVTSFRPKDNVTRAEFGTVLSRALWGSKNEGGITYYQNHLKALKADGIMNNISSPMDKEVRGYVMLMMMRSAATHYYIIDENDTNYPEGCNTPGLYEPEKRCILSMYADNSRNSRGSTKSGTMLVAPAASEKVVEGKKVSEFCKSLKILGVSWESPASHQGSRSDIIKNKSKIYNLKAKGSEKPNHYWADLKNEADINCRIDGACGSESSTTKLSVRCVSWDKVKISNYPPIITNTNIKRTVIDNGISDVIKMLD